MSIVVTCSCTKTYRLPDRYAGKRCRCRDCGRRIEVPADAAAEEAAEDVKAARRGKARAKKAKDDPSRTTRRLSSQDNEILGERRRLRSSQRTRPVSESMHQLAPISLSGELPVAPPRRAKKKNKSKGAEGGSATATLTKAPAKRKVEEPKRPARRARDLDEAPGKAKHRKARERARDVDETEDAAEFGPKRARRAKPVAKAAKPAAKGKRRPGRDSGEDDAAPRGGRKGPNNVQVILVIAGILCLGIGLVIGGLMSSKDGAAAGASAGGFDARFKRVDAFKEARDWAGAKAELQKLAADAKAAGDAQAQARAKDEATTVEALVQFAAIEDDETKVATLAQYASHKDPALRLGVAMELKQLGDSDDARRTLAGLTADADKRVAETARLGLIHMGGPESIPFLAQAIEQTAQSGHKLGDIALERALELSEPEVAPVLCKALEVRKSAPPALLKKILEKLADIGADASCKAAVTPYASHADEGVKAAAQAVLDAISG